MVVRFLETHRLALSKSEEARCCRNLLEGMGKQRDLAREKVISVQAARAEATDRSMGELTRLLRKCD